MDTRTLLRAGGRASLATLMVLTVCELVATPAAHADPEVIIETPPVISGGQVLTVTQDITLSDPIIVTNPGTTLATTQQCTNGVQSGSFCLGTSDTLVDPDGIPRDWDPVIVSGIPSSPYRLPGSAMDWIVDEAETYVMATKGLDSIELVRAYARADIRAYVYSRLGDILNKRLYGEPMTEPEMEAYKELQAIKKDRLVQSSKWALEEYNKWSNNPCGYVPPSPPPNSGTDLPFVPNDASNSTLCTPAGSRYVIWAVTNGTPPADTFDRWAAYQHPTPAMKATGDTTYKFALTATASAYVLAAGFFAAGVAGGIVAALALGMSPLAAVVLAATLGWSATAVASLGFGIIVTVAFALTAIVVAFVAALATIGVAIWQMIEDAKPGADLRDRAAQAAANDDPLGVEKSRPDYAALDYATVEEPADATKKATVHTVDFQKELFLLVHDWQMFRIDGQFIPDPQQGFNTGGLTLASDIHFAENGVPKDLITVMAPPGMVNIDGEPLSGYRVKISRGLLMVAELVTGEQTFRPYQPRTKLKFVDESGDTALMSLIRVGQVGGPPVRKFLVSKDVGGVTSSTSGLSWTYFQGPGVLKTITLLDELPVTPQVNVIPSVQGDLVADHVLTLKANASTPALSKTGGQYTWAVQRLDDSGNVVDTFNPGGNFVGFGHRYDVPGRYRALVTFSWTGPEAGSASGRVEFEIEKPAAEAHRSGSLVEDPKVDDDRVNTGALSLDLRMTQNTRSDTFAVDVVWADDGLGNEVVKHYTVQCVDAGENTCDTGPLIAPGPNEAPTNPQWSEAPTFLIPDDANFLPHVRVSITNSYGEKIERTYAITGDHRPKYATMTPYAEMPAGTFSVVNVVQVFPSDLFPPPSTPGIEQLQIQPFMADLVEQLPPGVTPQIQQVNGEWWLQLRGEPTADSIGQWNFYYPFEQNVDVGNARRPAPALTTLEVVSSTAPGYRGIIRGAPQNLSDRVYRTDYPEWTVQAAQRLPGDEGEFTDFTGTVKCKLFSAASGNVVFDKPCTANAPFPWPAERVPGSQFASVYLESATEPISGDGPYEVNLIGNFLDPTLTVNPVGPADTTVSFKLRVDDVASFLGVVPPPFSASGYEVTCSLDGGAFAPCMDGGTYSLPKTPGAHALDVKVKAPDGATAVRRGTWDGGPFPPPPPVAAQLTAALTALPAKADALKARFDLAVGYGGAVAPPYGAKGFTATCVMDGAKAVPCFDGGSLELLRVPGKHQLSVTVKATDGQAATQSLAWQVATPKKTLTVKAPATAEAGTKIKIRASGLLPREKFVVKVAGEKVAKGEANDRGRVVRKVKLDGSLDAGKVKVVVLGATKKRTGKDIVKVVAVHARFADPRMARILV